MEDAHCLRVAPLRIARLDPDQPQTLQQIDHEQRGRDELRRSDGTGIEKSA